MNFITACICSALDEGASTNLSPLSMRYIDDIRFVEFSLCTTNVSLSNLITYLMSTLMDVYKMINIEKINKGCKMYDFLNSLYGNPQDSNILEDKIKLHITKDNVRTEARAKDGAINFLYIRRKLNKGYKIELTIIHYDISFSCKFFKTTEGRIDISTNLNCLLPMGYSYSHLVLNILLLVNTNELIPWSSYFIKDVSKIIAEYTYK